MVFPYVAAALGAFILLLQQTLMLSVGFHRTKVRVGIGVGEDAELERKVRRHGNLAENSGIFLIVLALMEMSELDNTAVFWFAVVFAIARISHAVGFTHQDGSHANLDGNKFFLVARVLGATLTGWTGLALGGYFGYLILTA
ncbi:MAG: MAPEG family protein [Pseudomonadales bacterium]